jgi:NAD-dependent dihydropyrimidine dehydrogenase PreA subunit
MGITRIDTRLCNGCGICIEQCPMDVLRMDKETGKAYIKYLRDCQSCFLCERECPEGAILIMPFFERRVPKAWIIL